jgi:biotin carboxyl carrier protein
MKVRVAIAGGATREVELPALVPGVVHTVRIDDRALSVELLSRSRESVTLLVDGERYTFGVPEHPEGEVTLYFENRPYHAQASSEIDRVRAAARSRHAGSEPITLYSQLPGVVRQVFLEAGSAVEPETPVLTLEAMKMENEVHAEIAGVLEEVFVQAGQSVAARAPLARVRPKAAPTKDTPP